MFAKYWVNLKQLMRNSEMLWRKSKIKLTPEKPDPAYDWQNCIQYLVIVGDKF